MATGVVLAIAGEGRIHVGERCSCRSARVRVLRPALRGAARPDRDQRHQLAPVRRPGPGQGGGADRDRAADRPRDAVGDADRARLRRALHGAGRGRPGRAAARPLRALADRALQRVAGGSRAPGSAGRRSDGRSSLRQRLAGTSGILAASDTGGLVAATGLSADPTEYRARLRRADRRADRRLGGRADARRRDPPRDRQGRRGLPHAPPGSTTRGFERVFASGGGPPAVVGRR